MSSTLVYIPTILAYTFVALLLVILAFIIIYVSHKIYTMLYDNLPVTQLSAKYSLTQQLESMSKTSDIFALVTTAEGQVARKSKTG